MIRLPEDNDICYSYSTEIFKLVPEDGKVFRYIIKELSGGVTAGNTYDIKLICKYAPTTATDIIAYHTTENAGAYD